MRLHLFDYDNPHEDVVRDITILGDLTDTEWTALLGAMDRKTFPAATTILRTGEIDRTLYLISRGSVEVLRLIRKKLVHVAYVGEGSVVGEISFFDGAPRSATVVAREDVELLALPQARFEQFAAWHPRIAYRLLMDLGRVLSQRLRAAPPSR